MKKLQAVFLTIAMTFVFTSLAAAKGTSGASKADKPGMIAVDVLKWTGTVKAIDMEKRTVLLEEASGKTLSLNAKNARNLDQVKVGDKVNVAFMEELAVYVRKADAPPEKGAFQTVALAPKGGMPGGVIADTVEIQANVEGINYWKRTVTLKGPEGKVKEFKVSKKVKNFKKIKKGDQVVMRLTEALALEVVRP